MDNSFKTRKTPTQERAKQTVDKILRAGQELIIDRGIENISTNKIADQAQVNISSIYQYFPNKEAIIAAIIDDATQKMVEALDQELEQMMDLPTREVTKRWLASAIAMYRRSDSIFPHLIRSFHSASSIPGFDLIEKRLIETARRYTMRHRDRVTVEDVNVAIYVGFNAAMLVMSKHLMDPNSYLKDEEVIDGIAQMLERYMEG